MLNLELTSPPGGHGDDSTYSSDMDTNQDQDVVEDFARTLDRLVLQQQAETNHEESSDESDMEAFGYEQLPQDYDEDDDKDDAGYYEQHEQDDEGNVKEASDIMQAGKPEPVRFDITEDVNIPEDEAEFIKSIMSKIQLPKPEWAEKVSEELWLPQRKEYSKK